MMVRRVELEVQVADVLQAVTRARATATGAGGWVESEEVVPGDEDDKIVQVYQLGFRMGERLVRPARVVVSRKG